jgi:Domain of unknown function (DUF4349)
MPAALLLLLCIACNSNHQATSDLRPADAAVGHAPEANMTSADTTRLAGYEQQKDQPMNKQAGNNPGPTPVATTNSDWDKKIVKTADLTMEVKNFPAFTNRLHRTVKQFAGYIAQEQQSQSSYSIENVVTIKIPVEYFDDLLLQLPSDSDKLNDKKMSSEDVTMEVVDTKSRLETKKEVRERYLDLLKKAHNMKDILAIQEEIDGIQEEMDAASGRIAYLGHSAAFSTIILKFYQVLNPAVKEDAPTSFVHKIGESMRVGWNWCSSLLLGLCTLWPLWIMAVLGWMLWRRWAARLPRRAVAGTPDGSATPTPRS